jgi:hypothetical protein
MERTSVRGKRRRPLIGLAVLVLLLVAVAIASTGSVPSGTGGGRRPADSVLDTVISLFLLLMIVGVGLWVYVLWVPRQVLAQMVAQRARGRRGPLYTFGMLLLVIGLLAGLSRWLLLDQSLRDQLGRLGRGAQQNGGTGNGPDTYHAQFAVKPVLVVLALVLIAIVAFLLSERSRRRRLEQVPEPLLPALTDVLDETLDDLRAETDPRRAVIAAYARMERALAAYGLPRSPSEAPDEYLLRIFADLEVSRRATSRLTALFTWAKFSGHDVAPEMKQEAIEALEAVRAELQAAEILAEEQRLAAVAERRERAVT